MSHEDLLREHHDQLQGTGGFTNSRFKFGKPKLRKQSVHEFPSCKQTFDFTTPQAGSSRWIGSEMISSV
jgi:hypothetical protein